MLPASATARRKELAHRERMRLEQIEGKLDHVLAMGFGGAKAPPTPPAFSDADVEEVGKLLVEGQMIRLPVHARLTVRTSVEEVKSKIFGNSQLITHEAYQIHTKLLRPLTVTMASGNGKPKPRWELDDVRMGWHPILWSSLARNRSNLQLG